MNIPCDVWGIIMSYLDVHYCKMLALALGRRLNAFDGTRMLPLVLEGLATHPAKWCDEAVRLCELWQDRQLLHALFSESVIQVSDLHYMAPAIACLPQNEQKEIFDNTILYVDFTALANWTVAYFRYISTPGFVHSVEDVQELWNFFWLFINMNSSLSIMFRELRYFIEDCSPEMLTLLVDSSRTHAKLEMFACPQVRTGFKHVLHRLVVRYIKEGLDIEELVDLSTLFCLPWFSPFVQSCIWRALFFSDWPINIIQEKLIALLKSRCFLSTRSSISTFTSDVCNLDHRMILSNLPPTPVGETGFVLRDPKTINRFTYSDLIAFTLHFLRELYVFEN